MSNNRFNYVIDWDKIKNVEDIIEILKYLDLTFDIDNCNPKFKKFLVPIEE